MAKKRGSYSKEFKGQVALEAVKGQKTANELAAEFGVHATQINSWKKHLVDSVPEVFSRKPEQERAAYESERDRLYQQIGKLQVEVDWLKKTVGLRR